MSGEGRGLIAGHNIDIITQDGLDAGAAEIAKIAPDVHPAMVELVLNMVRSDQASGNEDRALKDLRQIVDLTGAYRVLAVMLTASGARTI